MNEKKNTQQSICCGVKSELPNQKREQRKLAKKNSCSINKLKVL